MPSDVINLRDSVAWKPRRHSAEAVHANWCLIRLRALMSTACFVILSVQGGKPARVVTRARALHPSAARCGHRRYAFVGGSADNIKKYRLPPGEFLHNMLQNQKAIISCLAVNEDGVMASGADNGSLWCARSFQSRVGLGIPTHRPGHASLTRHPIRAGPSAMRARECMHAQEASVRCLLPPGRQAGMMTVACSRSPASKVPGSCSQMLTLRPRARGRFWDWTSGNCFQQAQPALQPGSLESEANICGAAFDATGTRLLTAEGDKTVKFWRQDEAATPDSHPVAFRPPRDMRRF